MSKLSSLRKAVASRELDGILVMSEMNRRYLSGFTGSSGALLITAQESVLVTDFRYTEQAGNEAPDFRIVEHKKPLHEAVAELSQQLNLHKIAFEKDYVTYSQYEQYKQALSAELVPTSGLIEKLRLIKTDEEISILKDAVKIADDAFEHILNYIKPGVKEIDVSNELEFFMRKQGAASSSFDIIVASGYRSALPHGAASEKTIQSGELVTLDFGAVYKGYSSDMTRTVAVGEISDKLRDIYDTVLEAQLRGMKGIKAGITGRQADALCRDYIKEKGYGDYFGHSTGHGIGLDVHEGPGLSFRSDQILEEGMVVTVEPGIYIPEVGGCRIEDDLIVTATGNERLNTTTKELITL
ncbi:Xaa-Pro peptidase family protein [Halobacillus sp. ACCC02827]|uniref:M24 family metallopeptidase n=1 Tax=Bacillaceae TaxID=186817 RepID=UPI0002A52038|nr:MULTISPECIES: Xaa-Pro peptidase family protein [Bacillaceae]ELK46250.1 proline dipeptidase [Halobacillus sp. BAB-2008]QHT47133.1 aminopeptidase P family protein [Bacillus sp. SB49]WJE14360.1 Xaa-Pro peptidase family protein [Halobacillus sp. ACCC02827]